MTVSGMRFRRTRFRRITAAVLLSFLIPAALSGCWDSRELNELFIVTGVSLDKADNSDEMNIAFQIGKPEAKGSVAPGGGGSTEEKPTLLVRSTSDTVSGAVLDIDRDSSRTLMLDHNQAVLIGSDLAKQGGIRDHLDLFLRDEETRMEALIMVVDGHAEKLLTADTGEDRISGVYLWRMMEKLSQTSPYYHVRLKDFVSRLLEQATSPVAPVVTLTRMNDKDRIKIVGLAVFKGDRVIGRLDNQNVPGYLWAMGDVKRGRFKTRSESGTAEMEITNLDCKRDVTLREDGSVQVKLNVDASAIVGELKGFQGFTPDGLMTYLMAASRNEIRNAIVNTFDIVRDLNSDIYGIGMSVYRKYPREWRKMKKQWDKIFPETELDVKVRVRIPSTGQVVESLEMGVDQR